MIVVINQGLLALSLMIWTSFRRGQNISLDQTWDKVQTVSLFVVTAPILIIKSLSICIWRDSCCLTRRLRWQTDSSGRHVFVECTSLVLDAEVLPSPLHIATLLLMMDLATSSVWRRNVGWWRSTLLHLSVILQSHCLVIWRLTFSLRTFLWRLELADCRWVYRCDLMTLAERMVGTPVSSSLSAGRLIERTLQDAPMLWIAGRSLPKISSFRTTVSFWWI